MYLLGIVSLAQISLLPGAVLLRWFPYSNRPALEAMAHIFGLSLMFNAILVPVLVVLRCFSPLALSIVIAAECLILADRMRRNTRSGLQRFSLGLPPAGPLPLLAGVLCAATVVILCHVTVQNWGTVFSQPDDVNSWDKWAREWAASALPTRASWYPQLMPANWAVSYVLLGSTEVKTFAKATTTLYPLCIVLVFCGLAQRRRDPRYLFGGFLAGLLLFQYLGVSFLMSGYADVPVAFFGFLVLSVLLADRKTEPNDIALAILFATGALLTKQSGLYVFLSVVVYALWCFRRRLVARKDLLRPGFLAAGVAILFAAGWYFYKWVDISRGADYSHVRVLMHDLHGGRNYWERLLAAGTLFWEFHGVTGAIGAVVFAFLLVNAFVRGISRRLALMVVLPYLLIWALFFSYDIRNVALAYPAAALVCGLAIPMPQGRPGQQRVHTAYWCLGGIVLIAVWSLAGNPGTAVLPQPLKSLFRDDWLRELFRLYAAGGLVAVAAILVLLYTPITLEAKRGAVPAVLIVLVTAAAIRGWWLNPAPELLAEQLELGRRIGSPAANARLYEAVRRDGIRDGIVSDYYYLGALPDIRSLYRDAHCGKPCTLEGLAASVMAYPDGQYALMYDSNLDPSLQARLNGTAPGMTTIFLEDGVRFMRIDRSRFTPTELKFAGYAAEGSGDDRVIRLSYSHPQGTAAINAVVVIVNERLQGAGGCYCQWNRGANTITLANENGVGWTAEGKIAAGGPPLKNSYCVVDARRSRVTETGNVLSLTLALSVNPEIGRKARVHSTAIDHNEADPGYVDCGQWRKE